MKNPHEFVIDLSLQVGNLLKDRFIKGGIGSVRKFDTSLVTESDFLADKIITQSIFQNYPQDAIVSEEFNSSLSTLAESIWIVDPLDGTTNFVLGLPYWGVSIARVLNGKLDCAACYFPMIDELYSAVHNRGAFLNGKQIHTQTPVANQPAPFFSCCSRTYGRYQVRIPYKTRILGSAVYTFCAVASGIAVLGLEATPKIWDIAAGWLIVSEAGGAVETLDNESVFPIIEGLDYSKRNYATICAAGSSMLTKARSQITPINMNKLA